MAGRDVIDIWQNSQKPPSLSKKLQNVSNVELLLGKNKKTKNTNMNKLEETGTIQFLCLLVCSEYLAGVFFMRLLVSA